jgi:uncharacterized protein (DUF1697 family)
MQRYIALLRAINVGGHTVKMDHLRALFGALGYTDVETFIASGNVIFTTAETSSAALEKSIERHLEQSLGYAVATFVRTSAELGAVARYQPFAAEDAAAGPTVLYVGFLAAEPSAAAREQLLTFRSAIDDFHVHQREVYWLCRKTMSESTFSGGRLEKALGMPATLRNITTVSKLAAKYPPG